MVTLIKNCIECWNFFKTLLFISKQTQKSPLRFPLQIHVFQLNFCARFIASRRKLTIDRLAKTIARQTVLCKYKKLECMCVLLNLKPPVFRSTWIVCAVVIRISDLTVKQKDKPEPRGYLYRYMTNNRRDGIELKYPSRFYYFELNCFKIE